MCSTKRALCWVAFVAGVVSCANLAHARPRIEIDGLVEGVIRSQQRAVKNPELVRMFRFQSVNKFDELLDIRKFNGAAPDAQLLRRLDALTDDDTLRRAFRSLDDPWQRRLAVEMSEHASDILRRNGDEGVAMLRKMDKEGLVFYQALPAHRHILEDMFRQSGEANTVLRKTGKFGAEFYAKYVRPHKKKWIAAGLLAVFFSNPEYFIDTTGDTTRDGIKKLAELGVSLARGTVEGVAEGFLTSGWGIALFIVIAVVLINWLGSHFSLKKGWLFRWPVLLVFRLVKRKAPPELVAAGSSGAVAEATTISCDDAEAPSLSNKKTQDELRNGGASGPQVADEQEGGMKANPDGMEGKK